MLGVRRELKVPGTVSLEVGAWCPGTWFVSHEEDQEVRQQNIQKMLGEAVCEDCDSADLI